MLEALDAVQEITGAERTHVLGLCAGGIIGSVALAHLAAKGDHDRDRRLTLGVTLLDQERAGTVGAMVDRGTADIAVAQSQRKGYLDGKALAGVFAWLRPNDLIWNYWVNNYLLGKRPPAFDVLVLEHRHDADAGRACTATSSASSLDNSLDRPGGADGAGHADRPVAGRRRQLRRRPAAPTTSARGTAATGASHLLGGDDAVRAVDGRPHRRAGQPARPTRSRTSG